MSQINAVLAFLPRRLFPRIGGQGPATFRVLGGQLLLGRADNSAPRSQGYLRRSRATGLRLWRFRAYRFLKRVIGPPNELTPQRVRATLCRIGGLKHPVAVLG